MHTIHVQKWLRLTPLTQPPSPHFSPTTRASFSGDFVGKFIPNHPILPLLEEAHNHPTHLKTLHAYTITTGLINDTFAASRVVEFCLNASPGDCRYARAIFDSVNKPDIYTWNAMIIGHATHESPDSGVAYYYRMLARRAPPNNYTFALLVKACNMGSGGKIDLGRKVHGQVIKSGVEDLLVVRNTLMNMYCNMRHIEEAQKLFQKSLDLDLISWNTMISAYGRCGDVENAREVFEKMPTRSLVSWSAMIDCYVKSERFSEALKLFNEMQVLGVKPDLITMVSVLKACANMGALDQGRWAHIYIDKNRLWRDMNVVLGTALVDMYAKCGCIDVSLELFSGMHERDVILWNAMIGGLAMHGHGRYALELFRRMGRDSVVPNGTTFTVVLCACTHAGMVHEGVEVFQSMQKDYRIEPQCEHYGCLADLLGRAGLVQEAEEVINSMPMEPMASQWGALMAACRMHNNVEVGERVGKRLISLEPHDGGRYVLLSNVYAAAGRWGDALEMRRVMEEKGAKKETGCSFIECGGVIHEFVVGDTSHVESREIYAMLGVMQRELKDVLCM